MSHIINECLKLLRLLKFIMSHSKVEKLLSRLADDAPNVNARRMTSRTVGSDLPMTGKAYKL